MKPYYLTTSETNTQGSHTELCVAALGVSLAKAISTYNMMRFRYSSMAVSTTIFTIATALQ